MVGVRKNKHQLSVFNAVPLNYVTSLRDAIKDTTYEFLKTELKENGFIYDGSDQNSVINYHSYQYLCDLYGIENPLKDICYIKITKIEKLENSEQIKLCDLTVNKNHNFLCLGVICHNSEGIDLPDLNTEIMATPVTDVE